MKKTIYTLFALILFISCESPTDPFSYKEELVVRAMLYTNEPIDSIRVSVTAPVSDPFSYTRFGLNNAEVVIIENGTDTLRLQPYSTTPGAYFHPTAIVKPLTKYELRVSVPGFETITAVTFVPDQLGPLSINDTLLSFTREAKNEDSLTVRWDPVESSFNYLVQARYIDNTEKVEKIDLPFNEVDPGEDSLSQSSWVNVTRGRVYSFFHRYYGRHEFSVTAMDSALWNYIKTQFQNPRQLNEPISNLSSGIGYFASGSRRTFTYTLVE